MIPFLPIGVLQQQIVSGGGPFLPTDIGSLWQWLDASNRGVTSLQWDDVSGNARHMTSTSAGEFPSFAAGEADFDGSDYMTGPSMAGLSEGELFIRLKLDVDPPTAVARTGPPLWSETYGGAGHYPYTDGVIYNGWGSNARKTCGNPAGSLTAYHTLNIHSKTSDWALKINGGVQYSTGSNAVQFYTSPSLARVPSSPYYFNGFMKSMCVFSAKLSTDDRAAMEAYMGAL